MRREDLAEGVTVYLGDCRDILPTIGKVDAILTDPPYGINADRGAGKSADKWSKFTGDAGWDAAPVDADLLSSIIALAEHSIIWGGNYFSLPATPCWLIWDKETAGVTTFADCEVAWTNLAKAMRLKRHLWSGPYMKVKEERFHPTQKPLPVMQWCIEQLPAKAAVIADPFMGSGTTGVAAVSLGKGFVGCERDERYFDISCRRIANELRRPRLFTERPPAAKQEVLL